MFLIIQVWEGIGCDQIFNLFLKCLASQIDRDNSTFAIQQEIMRNGSNAESSYQFGE